MNIKKKLAIAKEQLARAEKERKELLSAKPPFTDFQIDEINKKKHEIGNIKMVIIIYEDLIK